MKNVATVFSIAAVGFTFIYYAAFRILNKLNLIPTYWFEGSGYENGQFSFFDWMTMRDYDQMKLQLNDVAIRHLRRGNVSIQYGHFLSDVELRDLSMRSNTGPRRSERQVAHD